MIEVRYAGAVVGRSTVVRELDTRGLFLGVTEPMPVGTEVTLKIGDDDVPCKVAAVSESQEVARAGMRVVFVDSSAAALFGSPGEALAEAVPAPVAPSSSARAAPAPTPPSTSAATVAAPPAAPEPVAAAPSESRSIVVDASAPAEAPDEPGETSGPISTGGGGGNKKNRRNRRR